jgi:hypothetical protein
MPSNNQLRSNAMNQGAFVTPFNQPEAYCSGYVAWWLRSRIQNKSFFSNNKYFDIYPGEQVESGDLGTGKAGSLQLAFATPNGQSCSSIQRYITEGVRADKKYKETKAAIARLVTDWGDRPIANSDDEPTGICNSFRSVNERRLYARYSIHTKTSSTSSHSVGLDFSNCGKICYFDPNIGEFVFVTFEEFLAWWKHCYENREPGTNAFSGFDRSFSAEWYGRP